MSWRSDGGSRGRLGCPALCLAAAMALLLAACRSPVRPRLGFAAAARVGGERGGRGMPLTPGAPFEPPPGPAPGGGGGPVGLDRVAPGQPNVLARVAGETIDKADFADFVCLDDPVRAQVTLDKLVKLRILRQEMKRLRVEVPEAKVREAVAGQLRQDEAEARADGRPLGPYVEARYGLSLEKYERWLEVFFRTRLARDRVVRYAQTLEDRVEGQMIVVATRAEAVRVREQLAAGADFTTLARKVSIHVTKTNGGFLPPLGRWGVSPELEKVLFSLPRRGISAPIRITEYGKDHWVILKCVRFHPARRLSYADLRGEIEAGLARRPFQEVLEMDGWIRSVEKRYKVEKFLRDLKSPDFLGEPVK